MLEEFKSATIFLISGFAVSPVLKTLTETISTDTIYSMVTIMMLVHLLFYDYGTKAAIVSSPISLNAAIFGAVCLASRLSSIYHVFALMVLASDMFVMFTVLRHRLKNLFANFFQSLITLTLAFISFFSLRISCPSIYSLLYLIFLSCVNFVFPYGFFKLQFFKE